VVCGLVSRGVALLVLFIPFILNFAVSSAIAGYVAYQAYQKGLSSEEIGIEIQKAVFTYNFYWSIIQVGIGLWVIRLMGGFREFKKVATIKDVTTNLAKSIGLILGLAALTQAIIWVYMIINAYVYGGWEEYIKIWEKVVKSLPLYSKIYLIAIAPFTAGIFEEIIWRWFGIEALSKYFGASKAVIIQAIAFGIWHGISPYAAVTAIIGVIYGLIYLKRRRLLTLMAAHTLADIVGFTLAFAR